MAFGITSLRKLKEQSEGKTQQKFMKNIIVGDDLSTLLSFAVLKHEYAPENLAVMISSQISAKSLERKFKANIGQIRDDSCAEILKETFKNISLVKSEKEPVFYKDSEFKPFNGKTKLPMELQGSESEFVSKFYDMDFESLLNCFSISYEQWNELDEALDVYRIDKEILNLKMQKPTDLINKDYWSLFTRDNYELSCENLIWSKGTKAFLKLLVGKDELSEDIIQCFESVESRPGYFVNFEMKESVFEQGQTVFLPQSLTHEWGHFVGEFSKFDNDKNSQSFSFQAQIHDEEINSEELARKIKLLRRTLKRVFENFKTEVSESIYFNEDMFIGEIEDSKFQQILDNNFPHLFFIGDMAPLKNLTEQTSVNYLTRALLSVNNLTTAHEF